MSKSLRLQIQVVNQYYSRDPLRLNVVPTTWLRNLIIFRDSISFVTV